MTDFYPLTEQDDAYEQSTGTVSVAETRIVCRTNSADYRTAAIRVRLTGVNNGDTIYSSSMSYYAGTSSRSSLRCDVIGEKVVAPLQFAAVTDHITDRLAANPTTASVEWQHASSGTGWYISPDLSTVIQELVNQPGWSDGGDIVLFLDPAAYTSNEFAFMDSFSGSNTWYLTVTSGPSNSPPTITQDTADGVTMGTLTPSVSFTGGDGDADPLRYGIQISNNNAFPASLVEADANSAIEGGVIHPNPMAGITPDGNRQVDDRVCWSVTGNDGELEEVDVFFGLDVATDGTARVLVYEHAEIFGSTGTPLNPALPADTPTRDWIAESVGQSFSSTVITSAATRTFTFTGANKIKLVDGVHYFFELDWIPNDALYDNTIRVSVAASGTHPGNMYLDGASLANNGVWSTNDMRFALRTVFLLLDKTSDVDPGFVNTINGADFTPFDAGDTIRFTVQASDALIDGETYYWRTKVLDVGGIGTWTAWTSARSFVVTIGGVVQVALGGVLSSNGAILRTTSRTVNAIASQTGVIGKNIARAFGGVVASAAAISKMVATNITGLVGNSGTITRVITTAVDGLAQHAGSLKKRTAKYLYSSSSITGLINRKIAFTVAGVVNTVGSAGRKVAIVFNGAIETIGSLLLTESGSTLFTIALAGSQATTGYISKITSKTITAIANSSSNLTKKVRKFIYGIINSDGVVHKIIRITINSVASMNGTIKKAYMFVISGVNYVTGSISNILNPFIIRVVLKLKSREFIKKLRSRVFKLKLKDKV